MCGIANIRHHTIHYLLWYIQLAIIVKFATNDDYLNEKHYLKRHTNKAHYRCIKNEATI